MNEQGFIKLNRKYFDHFLWNEPRTFSKAEAWLDLIGSARFEASTELINGHIMDIRRGEMPASRRFLEQRWKWGSTKVANFLQTLTRQGMIQQRQEHGQTIITLCRYDHYNNSQTSGKPAAHQQQATPEPAANQNKEEKESKENKEFKINYPYTSEKFRTAWQQLTASPKWKKKPARALQLSLDQLARFEEEYAIRLVELAAANNWQGVVFPDTQDRYRQWKEAGNNNGGKANIASHNNNKQYEKF